MTSTPNFAQNLRAGKNFIKICGITTPQMLDVCCDFGADLAGFVAVPQSPRCIPSLSAAATMREQAQNKIGIVVLFSDANDIWLDIHIKTINPDIIQLHGNESPSALAKIKDKYGLPIIKALNIGTKADLEKIELYQECADIILLDSSPTDTPDALKGGSGQTFDWNLIQNLHLEHRFILSGGLNPQNVISAIEQAKPTGVDVSSGVEIEKGIKSAEKIQDFIQNAKSAFGQ